MAATFDPLYDEVKATSTKWISSFKAFNPSSQRAFDRCDFSLLPSLAYPDANSQLLRVACDMMHLFFVFDEYTDRVGAAGAKIMADALMKGMRQPGAPQREIVGEISRDFWGRALQVLDSDCQQRFIDGFQTYTDAVVQQARDRETLTVLDISQYFCTRRETIGTKACWVLLQVDMALPQAVLEHPALVQLETLATDMVILGNDLYSYNVEQARGDDGHNILTIVRNAYDWPLPRAVQWLEEQHDSFVTAFLTAKATLPAFGEHDMDVKRYVDGLANWVRANEAWSFESERYFGADGLKIQRSRCVVLRSSTSRCRSAHGC